MSQSSYDVLFGKVARKALFADYYPESVNLFARVMLKPPEDRNVDFIATFSRTLEEGKNSNGEAIFRWQRNARDANNYAELNMSTWTQSLRLSLCAFYPTVGLGLFSSHAVLPVSRFRSNKDSSLGLRYGSSNLSVGTIVNPGFGGPSLIWFVGKMGKLTAGCQFKPQQRKSQ
ncbi:hypothetical protein L7F22_028881 [Adiantum nelumboides]|nr:hypothetical protein [Adiantum nelumboides]